MAKRYGALSSNRFRKSPPKTKKRLAKKQQMLAGRVAKRKAR